MHPLSGTISDPLETLESWMNSYFNIYRETFDNRLREWMEKPTSPSKIIFPSDSYENDFINAVSRNDSTAQSSKRRLLKENKSRRWVDVEVTG